MTHSPGSTLRTRPTLLLRVHNWEDQASWEELYRIYRRLVYGRARRAGLSHEDAEDVAQDVFKRVAETIRSFDVNPERGSFRGWLMQLTQWRIADQFARRAPPRPGGPPVSRDDTSLRTATIDRIPAPADEEDEWDREWESQVLAAAVDRIARRVKPRHFQVFDLYVRQRWPVFRVASELGVNPASVYVIAHRITRQLRSEVEKLQARFG